MKRWIAAAVLIAAALGAFLSQRGGPALARVGEPAPAFSLPDLSGNVVRLADARGRVLLLNFWATWCESCEEEMPFLEALHKKYRARGLSVLSPAMDGSRAPVLSYLAKTGVTFPVALADARVAHAYGVRGLPTTYLIDRDGVVVRKWVGPLDLRALENDILTLLEKS